MWSNLLSMSRCILIGVSSVCVMTRWYETLTFPATCSFRVSPINLSIFLSSWMNRQCNGLPDIRSWSSRWAGSRKIITLWGTWLIASPRSSTTLRQRMTASRSSARWRCLRRSWSTSTRPSVNRKAKNDWQKFRKISGLDKGECDFYVHWYTEFTHVS